MKAQTAARLRETDTGRRLICGLGNRKMRGVLSAVRLQAPLSQFTGNQVDGEDIQIVSFANRAVHRDR